MKQNEQSRVEQVLNSWDGVKRAEAPAFFYTRLRARMDAQQTVDETPKNWVFKPVFVIASLVLVIIINAFIYFQNDNSTISSSYDESSQSITAEFFSSDNILEDINED
jgi:hypothetical protein